MICLRPKCKKPASLIFWRKPYLAELYCKDHYPIKETERRGKIDERRRH